MNLRLLTRRLFPVSFLVVVSLLSGGQAFPGQPAPLTPQQKERLQERDRFEQLANSLRRQKKLPEAIAAAEQMLAVER